MPKNRSYWMEVNAKSSFNWNFELRIQKTVVRSDIYIIPIRLESQKIPESLRDFQCVDLFQQDGWGQLEEAIKVGMGRRSDEEQSRHTDESIPENRPFIDYFKKKPLVNSTFAVLAIWGLIQTIIPAYKYVEWFLTPEMRIRFDFEKNNMGWIPQSYVNNWAILAAFHSGQYYNTGSSSLALNLKLIGGDRYLDQGEVYVNMLQTPPEGIVAPLDLEGVQIVMWVKIPKNVVRSDRVGGMQLFLKDEEWRSLYGQYIELDPRSRIGEWINLTLVPGKEDLRLVYMSPGFNAKKVIAIGLRIDACGTVGCIYEGNIFIDSVSW